MYEVDDAVAKIDGYIISVKGAGPFVGSKRLVRIEEAGRTAASAVLIDVTDEELEKIEADRKKAAAAAKRAPRRKPKAKAKAKPKAKAATAVEADAEPSEDGESLESKPRRRGRRGGRRRSRAKSETSSDA
jgi:ribonuclease G